MENLNKLPFLNISKENFELMDDLLEKEQIGNVISAIYHYCYNGVEPQLSKVEMGVFKNIISVIERKGKAYLNKIEAGKNNFEKANQERKRINNNEDEDLFQVMEISDMKKVLFPVDIWAAMMGMSNEEIGRIMKCVYLAIFEDETNFNLTKQEFRVFNVLCNNVLDSAYKYIDKYNSFSKKNKKEIESNE